MRRIFEGICARADQRNWEPVNILSASHRDVWAQASTFATFSHLALTVGFQDYAKLVRNYKNNSFVRDIQSSAFIVCLDKDKPEDPVEFSRALWHGGPDGVGLGNRWYVTASFRFGEPR